MTELEYDVLSFVKAHDDTHWIAVLNAMHPGSSYEDTGYALQHLVAVGLLEICSADRPPYCSVRISARGGFALLEEISFRTENVRKEQNALDYQKRIVADEHAQRKKEKNSDRQFQFLLTIVQAILALVTGILIEYHTGIIDLVKEFF